MHHTFLGATIRLVFIGAVCQIPFLVCAFAAAADDEAQALIAEIKKFKEGDRRTDYSVTFCARPGAVKDKSVAGHAFIILTYGDAAKQATVMRTLGFFPEKGTGIFGSVPGEIVEDVRKNTGAAGLCLFTVLIDDDRGKAVEKLIEEFKIKDYKLADQNCVAFTMEVAKKLDLKLPDRDGLDRLPITYMRKMAEMNKPK